MRTKADNSFETGKMLAENNDDKFWNSSVHCFYYSVLQYMKHLLNSHIAKPLPYSNQNTSGGSSHDFILDQIKNRLTHTTAKFQSDFTQKFRCLRQLRVEADYSDKQFTQAECLDCRDKATELFRLLNNSFKGKTA